MIDQARSLRAAQMPRRRPITTASTSAVRTMESVTIVSGQTPMKPAKSSAARTVMARRPPPICQAIRPRTTSTTVGGAEPRNPANHCRIWSIGNLIA